MYLFGCPKSSKEACYRKIWDPGDHFFLYKKRQIWDSEAKKNDEKTFRGIWSKFNSFTYDGLAKLNA